MNRHKAPVWLLSLLKWLSLVFIIVSVGAAILYDQVVGYSILLGGLIYVLPNYIMLRREILSKQRQTPVEHEVFDQQGAIKQMYAYVVIKVLSTVALFSAVFYFVTPLYEIMVLAAFIAAFVFNFVLSAIMANKHADELFKEGEI